MSNEICILCGKETNININTNIELRGPSYVEGAGQLCGECYLRGNQSDREMITIPRSLIKSYPNDMELGSKIRQYYYEHY